MNMEMDPNSASKPLFPAAIGDRQDIMMSSLFPAFSASSTKPSEDIDKTPSKSDWLTNHSFKPDDAVVIHKIHQTRPKLETGDGSLDLGSSSEESEEERKDRKQTEKRPHHPTPDDESSDEPSAKKHKKKKKKKEKHKKKKKHKRDESEHWDRKRHKEDKSEKRKTSPIPVGTPGGKVFIEEMSALLKVNYRLDRKPDKDNFTFLQLYKMRIARYRRHGLGCLGMPPGEVLILEGDKKKDHKKDSVQPRYYVSVKSMKRELSVSAIPETQEKKQRKSRFDQTGDHVPAFIPIDKPSDESPRTVTNPLGVYDSATSHYLEGKPSMAQQKELTSESVASQLDSDEINLQKSGILSRTAMYNKHLQDHPHDIEKWLEYVAFQNEAVTSDLSLTLSDNPSASNSYKRKPNHAVLLEIKTAIIEEAIRKNPASVQLKMKHLELCDDHWEPAQLDKEWEKLVFAHPNNSQVWWQRLLHLQSSVSLFTISKLFKAYAKCLGMLTSIRDGTFKSHPPGPHFEEHMHAIFKQLVGVLLQAGHTEKAIALLQASIELNLFCPEVLHNASRADKLQFLENFWDSAMPRSAETGALGFATWIERKGDVPYCSMYSKDDEITAEDEAIKDVGSRSQGWLGLEASRNTRHLFPWRHDSQSGETEEDCEDLDRIVMLDDISSCIVLFESKLCHFGLITTYLQALGVKTSVEIVSSDKVIQRALRSNLDNLSQLSPCPNSQIPVIFSNPTELTFQAATNLLLQVQTAKVFSGHFGTAINLALMEVRKQHLGLKWKAGAEGKEWKSLCKELRKNAKNVLKEAENRNNLLLWEQYMDVEWALGSQDDALRILYTALAMTPGPKVDNAADAYSSCATCKLYRHYAEVELGLHVPRMQLLHEIASGCITSSSANRVLYVLTSLADSDKFIPPEQEDILTPATSILRARLGYQATLEVLLLQQGDKSTWSHGTILRILPQVGTLLGHWTTCFALFQYLTLGIGAAVAIFEQVQTKLKPFLSSTPSNSCKQSMTDLYMDDDCLYYQALYEDLVLTQLKLLQRHMYAKVAPMSLLRTPLQQHLQAYPDSAFLLHLYINLEATTNIVGRLRRHLAGLTSISETPLVWVYGTLADMIRHEKMTRQQIDLTEGQSDLPEWMLTSLGSVGSQHQLRSWLERAVNHQTSRYCILLWRLYFNFEVSEGQMLKAKSVYYRGIAQCPAAKALCMDFVRAFPDKLEEVTDLMLEKELRLRVPLEEVDVLLPEHKPRPVSALNGESDLGGQDESNNGIIIDPEYMNKWSRAGSEQLEIDFVSSSEGRETDQGMALGLAASTKLETVSEIPVMNQGSESGSDTVAMCSGNEDDSKTWSMDQGSTEADLEPE